MKSNSALVVVMMTITMMWCCLVCPSSASRTILEPSFDPSQTTHHSDAGWERIEGIAPHKDHHISLSFALKHKNKDHMESLFWQVSDPEHENYGKFLSHDDVHDLFAPDHSSVESVKNWLLENGVAPSQFKVTANHEFVHGQFKVHQIESLLHTKVAVYNHQHTNHKMIRGAQSYSVPDHIADHVDVVMGLQSFPVVPQRDEDFARSGANVVVTENGHVDMEDWSQNTGEPYVFPPAGGDRELSIGIDVKCRDGNLTGAPLDKLCSDRPGQPTIKGFEVRVEPYFFGGIDMVHPFLMVFSMNDVYCSQNGTHATICHLPIRDRIQNFVRYRILVQTQFTNGDKSKFVFNKIAGVASPFATIDMLKQYYGVPSNHRCTNPRTSQAVAEFLEEYYSAVDLNHFLQDNGLPDLDVVVTGHNNPNRVGGEASLDIQYIVLAKGAHTEFWSFSGREGQKQPQEPFQLWMTQMANTPEPPLVHSISYADNEKTLSVEYKNRLDEEFKKAGLRGISLLFSSGDDGCVGSEQVKKGFAVCGKSTPVFPSSSPYITSIGGTQWSDRTNKLCAQRQGSGVHMTCPLGEITSSTATGSRITSGGGFSNDYARPAYQKPHVEEYLKSTSQPPSTFFNDKGRAYPDISAIAHQFPVYMTKSSVFVPKGAHNTPSNYFSIDGTSASAPVAASLITIINDGRLNTNQKPLGFLNPWLYGLAQKHPEAFRDIVMGDNRCGRSGNATGTCCPIGFSAAPGWDAATGLGSVQFRTMFNLALNPTALFPLNGRVGNDILNFGLYHPSPVETTWLWIMFVLILIAMGFLAAFAVRNSREIRLIRDPSALKGTREYS